MTIARSVGQCEPLSLDWVEIEDEDGKLWRYAKKRTAPEGATIHVDWRWSGGQVFIAELVRGKDRVPILRQDELGLPDKIVVSLLEEPTVRGAYAGGWGGIYEYEKE